MPQKPKSVSDLPKVQHGLGQDRLRIRARGKPVLLTPRGVPRATTVKPASASLFDDFLPYLVVKLAHELTQDLIGELKREGVNLVRWRILAALASKDGSTISEIGERSMMQQSALSRMLMVMETEGYLTRRLRRTDERWVEVFLTPRGRKQFDSLNVIVRRRQDRFLSGFSPADVKASFSILERLSDNVRRR